MRMSWGQPPFGETRLQYFDFTTRQSRTVARNLGNVYLGLTASPDGRTIFYSRFAPSLIVVALRAGQGVSPTQTIAVHSDPLLAVTVGKADSRNKWPRAETKRPLESVKVS
jgi:hypothetical protein